MIPSSRLAAVGAYADFDAEPRFDVTGIHTEESPLCRSGEVLQGH
jgi:hydrogenase expression/formation protein HypD